MRAMMMMMKIALKPEKIFGGRSQRVDCHLGIQRGVC
jgi:hypothetical protein